MANTLTHFITCITKMLRLEVENSINEGIANYKKEKKEEEV
jgi:hypothetical protein